MSRPVARCARPPQIRASLARVGDNAPIGGRAGRPQPSPKVWIAIAVTLVAIGAGWFLFPLREWLETCERWIVGLGIWGVALFAPVYIFAITSLAREWPLTIVVGLLYGVWRAAITVVTATIAASVAFLIARYLERQGSPAARTAADIFRDRRT